jgi:hypothetical protein
VVAVANSLPARLFKTVSSFAKNSAYFTTVSIVDNRKLLLDRSLPSGMASCHMNAQPPQEVPHHVQLVLQQ